MISDEILILFPIQWTDESFSQLIHCWINLY